MGGCKRRELDEVVFHRSYSGLLQHHFTQPNAVGVGYYTRGTVLGRDTPRHFAGMAIVPIQKVVGGSGVTQNLSLSLVAFV